MYTDTQMLFAACMAQPEFHTTPAAVHPRPYRTLYYTAKADPREPAKTTAAASEKGAIRSAALRILYGEYTHCFIYNDKSGNNPCAMIWRSGKTTKMMVVK